MNLREAKEGMRVMVAGEFAFTDASLTVHNKAVGTLTGQLKPDGCVEVEFGSGAMFEGKVFIPYDRLIIADPTTTDKKWKIDSRRNKTEAAVMKAILG